MILLVHKIQKHLIFTYTAFTFLYNCYYDSWSFTNARVIAKYHGIKLEYWEHWHHVYQLLNHLKSKLNTWRGPYGSQESVLSLLQDWDVSHVAILNIQVTDLRKNSRVKVLCYHKWSVDWAGGMIISMSSYALKMWMLFSWNRPLPSREKSFFMIKVTSQKNFVLIYSDTSKRTCGPKTYQQNSLIA